MSRNAKIAIGIVVGLIVVCAMCAISISIFGARAVSNIEDTDPAEVGAEIIDYQLPTNFTEEMGFSLFGMRMVAIDMGEGVIMLIEMPVEGASEEQMRSQLEEQFSAQLGQQSNMTFEEVSREEIILNGERSNLVTSEATDSNGKTSRQATAIFEAKSGKTAMMLIAGDADDWDNAAVSEFLQSMSGSGR